MNNFNELLFVFFRMESWKDADVGSAPIKISPLSVHGGFANITEGIILQ